jgi:hypothetical protein
MKNIYILCPVTIATDSIKEELESYVAFKEDQGNKVYYPARDTNQDDDPIDICESNYKAIALADEVHVFYNDKSLGSHFDLGIAFALHKRILLVEAVITGKYGGKFLELIKSLQNDL